MRVWELSWKGTTNNTLIRPDRLVDLTGFLTRPFTSSKARRTNVFPVMDGTPSVPSSSIRAGGYTINSLSELLEWRSVRSSNVGEDPLASSALLAIDLGPQRESSSTDREPSADDLVLSRNSSPRIRIKPSLRPRSYLQILEDFDKGSPLNPGFTTGQRSILEVSSTGMNNSVGASTSGSTSGYLSTSISTSVELSPRNAGPTADMLESPTSPEFNSPLKVRWSGYGGVVRYADVTKRDSDKYYSFWKTEVNEKITRPWTFGPGNI